MSKIQQLNEYGQAKQPTNRDVRQLGVLTGAKYEADSTASQTVINLNFSVAQTAEAKRGFQLFIDGQLLREGASNDFQFTGIAGGVSAQVTLNATIGAGLNIVAYQIGAYQSSFPSPSTVTATLLNDVAQPHLMALAGFQPFVQKSPVPALNTAIINRAPVDASLKPIAGNERIQFKGLSLLNSEFGSAGEPIYELSSKDSRIRFAGRWYSESSTHGNETRSTIASDYFEVTFYGTGLNILTRSDSSITTATLVIDGVSSSFNIPAMSNILINRNYNPNVVFTIASGLTLGWHTVRYQSASFVLNGIEVVNARTDLAILPGSAFGGMKQEVLSTLNSSAFNAGVVGIRGARVIKYIKDGIISQAVQEVNASSGFAASADHTNEEVIRRINFREFGANRSDDFSTLTTSTSSRAFTLDDGTTTLNGLNLESGNTAANAFSAANATNNFWTLTFVGTGLDLVIATDSVTRSSDVYVDGVLAGTISKTGNTAIETRKIISGLPYGTHTIRFLQTTAANGFATSDFIIYGPKKPSIPVGAIELADYNVPSNYVANTGTINPSSGAVRKAANREVTYVNTWSVALDPLSTTGFEFYTATVGAYFEYTFFGTGIELTGYQAASARNYTYSINGSSNLSAFTTNFYSPATGMTFTPATGVLSGTPSVASYGATLSIRGLPLGRHTVRVTRNAGGDLYCDSIDVITPIHSNSSSFKVGSLSLRDSRIFSPIVDKPEKTDLGKAKATLLYDMVTNQIMSGLNISAVLKTTTGKFRVFLEKPFKNDSYVVVAQVGRKSANGERGISEETTTGIRNKNSIGFGTTVTSTLGLTDCDYVNLVFFGELEDEGEN